MVIRNKDGSIFKLRHPNPLMLDQDFWDKEEEVETFNFNKIKGLKEEIVFPQKQEEKVVYTEDPEIVEEPAPTSLPEKTEPVKEEAKYKSPYRKMKRKYLNCLPVEIKKYKDELYDEDREEFRYRKPFKFQAVVLTNNDIFFIFWTTIEQVTERSIVFDGDYRRWWQVNTIKDTEEGDGFIAECSPSTLQPDFSEV